jgi:hypothetical protein
VSLFHQLVSPLDAAEIDPSQFWFPKVKPGLALRLDTSLDRSVVKLRELSEALRDDVDVVGMMMSKHQADKSDALQTGLQVLAAPFVAAAIVVGAYGANTWLPGRDKWVGFLIMVLATIAIAIGGFLAFRRYVRREPRSSA